MIVLAFPSALASAVLLLVADQAAAAAPRNGGNLTFAVVAEPPTIDCHATGTFAMIHPVIPQYPTLLKYVGTHDNLRTVGDLAESWLMPPDGLRYTFKLRRGVKFHDGTDLTSADVKASYERIANPAPGVISLRKAVHQMERYVHESSYSIPLHWYQRIVVNHRKVMGWALQPRHVTGQSLVDVWLDE